MLVAGHGISCDGMARGGPRRAGARAARGDGQQTRDYPRFRLPLPRRTASPTCAPSRRVILLNKPYGVLCQFTAAERPADARRLRRRCPDVYPAGRLDADSEGLVVLTADGALQARIARSAPQAREDLLGRRSKATPARDAARGARARRRARATASTRAAPVARDRDAAPALWPRDPPIRVRRAIPTAWLELTLARRPQPAGAADDRRGRLADAAAHPLRRWGRWTLGALAPGEWREEPSRRACYHPRAASPSCFTAPHAFARGFTPRSPMIRRLLARFLPGRAGRRAAHRTRRRRIRCAATR